MRTGRYNNRTYRIDEIDWKRNPRSTFVKRTGEKISYVEYYRKTYDRAMITDLEQVCYFTRAFRVTLPLTFLLNSLSFYIVTGVAEQRTSSFISSLSSVA